MEALGVRVLFAPSTALATLAFVLAGVGVGTVSGLTPGVHVNNLALLLAAVAPALPGPPHLVAATMLAAAVVHSFLDVVPALALGVPDAAMAVTALPGHRLVLEGRGREALRLSALGSGGAVLCALPLSIPLTRVMTALYPTLRAALPLVLAAVAAVLVLTEPTTSARLGGCLSLAASGALGLLLLDYAPSAPLPGDMLAPLFAGLFGAPVLLDALDGGGVPEQGDARIAAPRRDVGLAGTAGALAGAVVGYVPGVSSAVAATMALTALPTRTGDREFVVATSGVNTANTVFALFALVALGTPRTGVFVAMNRAELPLNVPMLLLAAALAACAGVVLVVIVGDRYLTVVGRLPNRRLCLGVLGVLAVVSYAFGGVVGVAAFAVSAAVGRLPVRFGARRVHLMGVLFVPLALP